MKNFIKPSAIIILVTFLFTTLTDSGKFAFALSVGSSSTASGNSAGQLGTIAESAGAVQSFQADLFTGRAQTGVPIFVPPGRKNVQPSLNLSYSSSGGNGWLGMGWGLDVGYIARSTKRGVPKYDSSDTFVFSYQGVSSELVSVATNEYRAKDEALFLKFIFDPTNNKWIVTDKSGTQHTFGDASGNRQAGGSGTFKWALCKVKDTSGNYMTVTYTTDSGELYLDNIQYNGNETESFAHSHKVEFTLEDRTDDQFSYMTGTKVETKKRLADIQVKVKNGGGTFQLARKYVMGYEYSTATKRSRLISVTEYGTDGSTSLPATTFVYQDLDIGFNAIGDFTGITNDSHVSSSGSYVKYSAVSSSYVVSYTDVVDMDGDGLLDRVQRESDQTKWKYYPGTGTSYGSAVEMTGIDASDSNALKFYVGSVNDGKVTVAALLDLNADGLPDRVTTTDAASPWYWQKNTGGAFAAEATITNISSANSTAGQYGIYFAASDGDTLTFIDMNGDGLPDRVMNYASDTSLFKVQFNALDGSGNPTFASSSNFTGVTKPSGSSAEFYKPRYYNTGASSDQLGDVELIDMNGDGLPDRVMTNPSDLTKWKVQFNKGYSFDSMVDWGTLYEPSPDNGLDFEKIRDILDGGKTTAGDLLDINGDGLPDRVLYKDSDEWYIQVNNGYGFESAITISGIDNNGTGLHSYIRMSDDAGNMALDLMDVSGDGLPDRVIGTSGATAWKVQKSKGPNPDLLKEIKNGRGGKTAITYSSSTSFDNLDTNGKPRLPFPIQAVTQVVQHDGMGNTYTTNYSYKGGMYDATNREFRGFREVTVTDAIGTKTIQTFGQTDLLKGRLLTKEVRDSSNNLFSKEETTWDDDQPYTDVNFVFVDQVDSYIYDGDGTYKQVRQEFTYDSYGNLASTVETGDQSIGTDSRKTVNEYVYNTTDYILNTLKKTTLYDTDLTTIKAEKYFYYDGASSISTAPTAGLLTKEEEWLSTASGCSTAGTCANNPKTTMTYDDYGNVETVTDARSYTTTNTYDSTYHLFLIEIENAASQTREFTYDPWLAQILTSTDQNSQVTETVYDVLGRVTKVIAPLDDSSEPTQEFAYAYPDIGSCLTAGAGGTPLCTTKTTTKVKSSVPGAAFTQLISYSFTDGLGREIERRSPAEDSGYQIVSGIVEFNSRGLVSKQYTPYFETTSSSFQTPVTSGAKAQFTYDAVGRRTRIDYPDSTNSQVSFSDFVKTTTDQRGKQLRYTNDAYGRLVTVEEFSSGSTFTTAYEYDVLNNLKKTTDNLGNETTISYDSLSRKTGMVDPDMGTWAYTYDLNDNLKTQTDAKSQVIEFTYDSLNRVTLKDLPGGETDVVYHYDSAPTTYSGQTGYWVGRLDKVTDASGTHEFKYDKQGRVIDDTKTVDATAYTFTRTYDSMGRVRTLTYPDTEVVTYTYNGFGDVETIAGVKSGSTTNYIKDVNYNSSGQITYTKYGNDVTSNYTYDSNTLRLSNILTKKPDNTTKLQDLTYTFDNNGNVSTIADTVNSMSQTFTYDDLNRLTQAVGSAYGTQNFAYNSIGNMTTKANLTMSYGTGSSPARPHAVTGVTWSSTNFPTFCRDIASGSCTMTYDGNGNMITRGGDTLSYDSENRLKQMKTYDGTSGSTNYTLKSGWNVISFTHLPDNRSVSNVLSSLTFGTDYDQVSYWDAASSTWKHWVNDSDFNDFTQFEYGKTYEIYNKSGSDKSLTVTGKTAALDITHNIVSGDNFISPNVKSATNITTVLSSLTFNTDYSDVKRFNAATQTWESYAASAFTQFEPGKGYNIVGLRSANFSYGKSETTTDFVYDSTGARVKKTASGTTTVYLGKDYDVTGALSTKYIFLGDRRIASKDSSNVKLYFHEDHINSSNVITDSSGNQAALYEYDPYGLTATHTGATDVKHQFTGQEKDDSTKLHYYNARYYDSQLGRFITADPTVQRPKDPQDFNRYAYARNNPIRFTDPTGLKWHWKGFFSFGVLGGLIGAAKAGAIVGAAVGIILAPVTAGQSLWITALNIGILAAAGAAGGALGGGIGSAIDGNGFLRGAASGAVSGAIAGATAGIARGVGGVGGDNSLSSVQRPQLADGTYGPVQIATAEEVSTGGMGFSPDVKGIITSLFSTCGTAYGYDIGMPVSNPNSMPMPKDTVKAKTASHEMSGRFYPAYLDFNENVVIIDRSKPMSFQRAVLQAAGNDKQLNVYAETMSDALAVAQAASVGAPYGPETHAGNGRPGVYYQHYHPRTANNKRSKSHVFFGEPQTT